METFNSRIRTSLESAEYLDKKLMVDGIVHCCNCFCNFNTPFGKKITALYPALIDVDKETEKGDRTKLGTYTFIKKTKTSLCIKGVAYHVINAYTYSDQRNTEFDYEALEKILTNLNSLLKRKINSFCHATKCKYD